MEENIKKVLFWQPKVDILKLIVSSKFGKYSLAILNYLIWIFLFFISYLLIKKNINLFGQLFFATVASEIIERVLKNKVYWCRPLYLRHDETPPGLVSRWYKTGSFPSGHIIKTVFFLLFLLQYPVFSPFIFLAITIPLLAFRIIIGLHYPIDMIGGALIGIIIWLGTKGITLPNTFNNFIQIIFNLIFSIT